MLDCHAHINDPGFTWREDLPHASEAAAVGGVTTLIDMPLQNTPPLTSADAFANKLAVFEGRSLVDYALWGGLVTDNTAELAGMDAAGAVGFKAFIAPVSLGYSSVDMGLAREALFRIKAFGGLAGFHCEITRLSAPVKRKRRPGAGPDGPFWTAAPWSREVIATANVIELARETGARVHICHVSHPRVAELSPPGAQADGLSVTGEACHITLFLQKKTSCHAVRSSSVRRPCGPPRPETGSGNTCWTAPCPVSASDRSPSRPDEKDEAVHGVMGAWGGLSGLQSLVQVMFNQAVTRRGCSPSLLARFASSAARVFGLDGRKGALGVGLGRGRRPNRSGQGFRTITAHSLRYLNPFSAFEGLEGVGLPVCTVVRGRVVAREGNVLAPFGHGLFQPRKP